MEHSIQYLTETLKRARLRQGLSQRALSSKVAIPQSHLSKIEKGEVDLQTSSLVEISRALELELMLVPRSLAPMIRALQLPQTKAQRPMYQPDQEEDNE